MYYVNQFQSPVFIGNQPHHSPSQSTHPLKARPLISQSPPSEADIRRCCRFVTDDIKLLAGLIGVTDPELADLQQSYSIKNICALRLIEKWMQKNPKNSKDDLYQLLVDADQCDAARSLVSSSYIDYHNMYFSIMYNLCIQYAISNWFRFHEIINCHN